MEVEFTHKELTLALFALQGGKLPDVPEDPCASPHDSCPVVEDLEERFGLKRLSDEQKLSQHLTTHLRQSWVECGLFDLADGGGEMNRGEMIQIQRQLSGWSCKVGLEAPERFLLYTAITKLPRSAWISMPRTVWRLRKKLKTQVDE